MKPALQLASEPQLVFAFDAQSQAVRERTNVKSVRDRSDMSGGLCPYMPSPVKPAPLVFSGGGFFVSQRREVDRLGAHRVASRKPAR